MSCFTTVILGSFLGDDSAKPVSTELAHISILEQTPYIMSGLHRISLTWHLNLFNCHPISPFLSLLNCLILLPLAYRLSGVSFLPHQFSFQYQKGLQICLLTFSNHSYLQWDTSHKSQKLAFCLDISLIYFYCDLILYAPYHP